jgi:hypothetical protein
MAEYAEQPAQQIRIRETGAARQHITMGVVWRDTLDTFGAHPAAILLFAFIGFAVAGLTAALVGTALALENWTRTQTILGSSFGPNRIIPLIVQAVVGLLAAAYARGAIALLALRHGQADTRWRTISALALRRLPLLVLVFVVMGALLYLGNQGIIQYLREMRIDLADAAQYTFGMEGMSRAVALHAINRLLPDPGAPFTELLSYVKMESARTSTILVYAGGLSFIRVKNIPEIPLAAILGVSGTLLLLVMDAVSRFAAAGIMLPVAKDGVQGKGGAMRMLGRALGLAVRRLGVVLAHIWTVRLAVFGVTIIFVTIPQVLVQSVLAPLLIRTTNSAWIYLLANLAVSVSVTLVMMVFVAFSAVYDARLFLALRRQEIGD